MFDTKTEVDKHVHNCLRKINDESERNLRSFAFAKLYFKVGDLEQARRYVTCYLSVKPLSTEGLNLLAKTLEKQGKLDLAVEAYKKSLDVDSKQNTVVIKICELMSSDDVNLDLLGARYYCDKAQSFDPHNPIVFGLKERLVVSESQDPNELAHLLLNELASRPTDVNLRVRLLHHLLRNNLVAEAYKHACEIEQKHIPIFANSLNWYEALAEVLIHYQRNNLVTSNLTWEYWMMMISVLDKLVGLTLTDHANILKTTSDCAQVLFNFDQTLTTATENIYSCNEKPLVQEFLNHYRAQLCFHYVTLLYKYVKRDLINQKEATQFILPLLFVSYHAKPSELRSIWLDNSSEARRLQIQRWHTEASFRCSQTGHLLLATAKDRKLTVIEKTMQTTSGLWREQLFKKLFITRDQQAKLKTSYFVSCSNLVEITIRLPEISDVVMYDEHAQLLYPDSLHLLIWICLHQQLPTFRCAIFEGLPYSVKNLNNCAAESLNLLDIESFLYCASLCAQSNQDEKRLQVIFSREFPTIFPAAVTDLLGTVNQMNWLKAAYKMYKNEYGAELSELRLNLIRGIEVVRCVGYHGLDVQLLITLATTFADRAKNLTKHSEIEFNDARAEIYWKAALPLLEKLEKNQAVSYASNRLFEYKSKTLTYCEIMSYVDNGKLFIAGQLIKKKEYEKALHILENIKNPYASYHQANIYKTMANEQINQHKENITSEMRSQHVILLSQARDCLYLTMDRLRDPSADRKHPLYSCLGTEIEAIERLLGRFDSSTYNRIEADGLSDENASSGGSIGDQLNVSYIPNIGNSLYHNDPPVTPAHNRNGVFARLHFNSSRREAKPSPERLDAQLRQMQASRDSTISQVLDQNRLIVESHRSLVNELRGFKDAVVQLTTTVEDLKTVKTTVNDELKSIKNTMSDLKMSVDGFNLADMSDLIQEMRRDISEIKKDRNKHNQLSEEDLYALGDEYGAEYNFNPNNLYPNLPGRLPSSSVAFPPTLYSSLYPMYPYSGMGLTQGGALPYGQEAQINDLRALNNIPQNIPQTSYGPPLSSSAVKPTWDVGISQQSSDIHQFPSYKGSDATKIVASNIFSTQTAIATNSSTVASSFNKAPVNVVITSSDPLPTVSVQTTQILSVTIPSQHLKGKSTISKQPHNYQIPLPTNAITTPTTTPAIMKEPSPIVATEGLLSNIAPPIYSALTLNSSGKNAELALRTEGSLSQSFGSNKDDRSFNKSNNSSIVEHDPCPDFKPIVPLPDEVPLTTGEENEIVLFRERAKLFRFGNKEWLERGVGTLKILKNIDSKKVRILMRRDQVHKLCANHYLTKDMTLTQMPKCDRAYIWAANDFSDGETVLEKLCVRFKTDEQGIAFHDAFENAKLDIPNASFNEESPPKQNLPAMHPKESFNKNVTEKNNSLGGFKFTSTPTFKALESTETLKDPLQPDSIKSSPFATFTFGSVNTSPQANIFTTPPKPITPLSPKTPDEFIPSTEFTPVVALPEIVEVKTGEENAEVLFAERAKLLRYDIHLKEWKERGTGTIKVLKQINTIRLLMRRDQVHKVCCNHQLLKGMSFSQIANNPKAISWSAQDYSESTLKTEIFTIRFKTEEQAIAFIGTIKLAQNSMDDNSYVKSSEPSETYKEEKKIRSEPKTDSPKTTGWDEKIKPKPSHWKCKNCFGDNEGKAHQCETCETPKPNTTPRKSTDNILGAQLSFGPPADSDVPQSSLSTSQTSGFVFGQKSVPATTLSWGDAFKPSEGSWECSACLLRNASDKIKCMACEQPKSGLDTRNVTKSPVKTESFRSQLNFGPPKGSATSSWGDRFKPKEGSWECKVCCVRNDGDKLYCLSCDSPKDDTVPKKDKGIDLGNRPEVQFKFGFQQTSSNTSTTFSFLPKSTVAVPSSQGVTEKTFDFGTNKKESTGGGDKFIFGSPGQHVFEFTPRSPRRHSSGCQGDEESDSFVEDEGEHIYFKPVVPLPDKIEVKSGEEDEEVLYSHRAKLFRFTQGEWRERGIGDIKILLRAETGKVRVLMRREQVLKICLNHYLTYEMDYMPKDEKTWLFSAPDYSDGDLNHGQFCVRFKNAEIAKGFKNAIESALTKAKENSGAPIDVVDDSDIEFVSETKVSPEEEKEALKLQLPKNFMSYRRLPDCACQTCKNEDLLLGVTKTHPSKNNLAFETPTTQSETLKSILSKPSLFSNIVNTENKTSFNSFSFSVKTNIPSSTTNTPVITQTSTTSLLPTLSFKPATTIPSMVSTGDLFSTPSKTSTSIFGGTTPNNGEACKNLFTSFTNLPSFNTFGSTATTSNSSIFSTTPASTTIKLETKNSSDVPKHKEIILKCDSNLSFANLATNAQNAFMCKTQDSNSVPFASLGAGAPVFASVPKKSDNSKTDKSPSEDEGENVADSNEPDHDPHFEPIIPLPKVVKVSTGEEDETAIFNERAKVYRYDNLAKEWKERGVGQFKILHHPVKDTYRFLLRREQVHKVVLNMLISPNLELQRMPTSEKAWIWWGHNHVEGTTSVENLAVRFKEIDTANRFYSSIMSAILVLKEKQDTSLPSSVQNFDANINDLDESADNQDVDEEEEEDEEDDERTPMFSKNCIFSEETETGQWNFVCLGTIELVYDPEMFGTRVFISNESGEIVSSSVIGSNTEITVHEDSCTWKAVEWGDRSGNPRWRTMKAAFEEASSVDAFHCSFLESVQLATEIGITDGIFSESEENDG